MQGVFFLDAACKNLQYWVAFIVRAVAYLKKTGVVSWGWYVYGTGGNVLFPAPDIHSLRALQRQLLQGKKCSEKIREEEALRLLKKTCWEKGTVVFLIADGTNARPFPSSANPIIKKHALSIFTSRTYSFPGLTRVLPVTRCIPFSLLYLALSAHVPIAIPKVCFSFPDGTILNTQPHLLSGLSKKTLFEQEKIPFLAVYKWFDPHNVAALVARSNSALYCSEYTGQLRNVFYQAEAFNTTFLFLFPFNEGASVPVLYLICLQETNLGLQSCFSSKKRSSLFYIEDSWLPKNNRHRKECFWTSLTEEETAASFPLLPSFSLGEKTFPEQLVKVGSNELVPNTTKLISLDIIKRDLERLLLSSEEDFDLLEYEAAFCRHMKEHLLGRQEEFPRLKEIIYLFGTFYGTGTQPGAEITVYSSLVYQSHTKQASKHCSLLDEFYETVHSVDLEQGEPSELDVILPQAFKPENRNENNPPQPSNRRLQRQPTTHTACKYLLQQSQPCTQPPLWQTVIETPETTDTEDP